MPTIISIIFQLLFCANINGKERSKQSLEIEQYETFSLLLQEIKRYETLFLKSLVQIQGMHKYIQKQNFIRNRNRSLIERSMNNKTQKPLRENMMVSERVYAGISHALFQYSDQGNIDDQNSGSLCLHTIVFVVSDGQPPVCCFHESEHEITATVCSLFRSRLILPSMKFIIIFRSVKDLTDQVIQKIEWPTPRLDQKVCTCHCSILLWITIPNQKEGYTWAMLTRSSKS